MISVLLVEDNMLALEYLKAMIDWESHGFSVVGAALNGKEGIKEYFALRPQVVITDIQMPAASGVELAARIREAGGNARIIFLTSYQLFSYAKSALDLGVSEYILKHELNEKTLLQKLGKVKAELGDLDIMARARFEEEVAERLFGQSDGAEQGAANGAEQGGFANGGALCSLFAFRRNGPLDILGRGDHEPPGIDINRAKKLCYNLGGHVMGVVQAESEVFLVFASAGAMDANDFAYALKDALEAGFGGGFTVLSLGEGIRIKDCRHRFSLYKGMFHERFFSKRSIVVNSLFYGGGGDDGGAVGDAVGDEHLGATPSRGNRNGNGNGDADAGISDVRLDGATLAQAVGRHDIDYVLKQIDSAFSSVISRRDYGGLLGASRTLMSILQKHEGAGGMASGARFKPYAISDEERWHTAAGVAEFFRDKFIELDGFLCDDKSGQYSPNVKTAVRYLAAGYKNVGLSVEGIAQRIGMNADWLGVIFKRDTGYSAREYLNMIRINKSKELIENGCKVSEVHKEVGYLTYQYFGKVFRKVTGLTPIEYRKSKNAQKTI